MTQLAEEHRRWLEENYDRMYAFALSQTHDREDAEDAVCDTAVTVIRKYETLANTAKFSSWAWGILRNILLRTRKYRMTHEFDSDIHEMSEFIADTDTLPPAETLVMAEERGRVRKILSMLPEDTRRVMEERYIRERSYKEIAEVLEIPLSSDTWRLSEGKKQMRKEWDFMELDTYMKDGYYTPVDLKIDVRYRAKGRVPEIPLDTLLAKNIAAVCYAEPITVTDISRIMGVPAAYIEDSLAKLLEKNLIKQTANRYQTAFPIIDGKLFERMRVIIAEKCRSMYGKWTEMLVKLADNAEFGSALNGDKLTREEKAYILFFTMGNFGRHDPFSDDGKMIYPHNNGNASWCVKAYTSEVDNEAVFPINHHFYDCGDELHFDASYDWFGYQTETEKLIDRIKSGEERAIIWNSRGDYLRDCECVREMGKMMYDDQLALRDDLISAVLALLPERFRECEAYVNCEIRNFIIGGWEEFLLENKIVTPAAFVVLKNNTQEPARTVAFVTQY